MPVLLTEDLHESRNSRSEASLFTEGGDLTVAGTVVADFLETADFTRVFEHPEAAAYVIDVVDEADQNNVVQVLPGSVALRLIDENDLAGMFFHYLDLLGENATGEDAPMEDKVQLAVFENLLLKPLDERYKRGAFRKIRGQKGGGELVNRMLGAIMQKGEIKRAKPAGSGYKGGDYERTGRYGGPERKATKQKRTRIRKQTASKIRQSQSRTRAARKRARSLAASVGMEESVPFHFGFGESYSGAVFQVGTREDAEVEFTEAELDTLVKTFTCYEGMEKVKGRRGMKLAEKADGVNESSNERRPLAALTEHFQPAPVGVAALTEGAGLAARAMVAMGTAKRPVPLEEAKR